MAREGYVHPELGRAAAGMFATSDRINQMLIEEIDSSCWRAKPPGGVRTIAAIFTHMHNVRVKWVTLSAPHLGVPALLNRARCTPQQAAEGLAESALRCAEMLQEALSGDASVGTFHGDGWSKAWPAGIEMLCYMLSHEAHHRGQVCMLARQLGFPLANEVTSAMWNCESAWRE